MGVNIKRHAGHRRTCGDDDHSVLCVHVRAGRLGRAIDPAYLPDAVWQQQPEQVVPASISLGAGVPADNGYRGAQRDCGGNTDLHLDGGDRRAVLHHSAQKRREGQIYDL